MRRVLGDSAGGSRSTVNGNSFGTEKRRGGLLTPRVNKPPCRRRNGSIMAAARSRVVEEEKRGANRGGERGWTCHLLHPRLLGLFSLPRASDVNERSRKFGGSFGAPLRWKLAIAECFSSESFRLGGFLFTTANSIAFIRLLLRSIRYIIHRSFVIKIDDRFHSRSSSGIIQSTGFLN